MKSSTRDKVQGTAKVIKGKVEENVGKATSKPSLRDKGQTDKREGRVQKKVGDIKKVFDQ